jgi:hypothetical protein
MKTKKRNIVTEKCEVVQTEEEYIDRKYYIPKILEKIKKEDKTVVIEIYRGCLSEVHNLPDGFKYELVDWDALEENMDEEEFKKLLEDMELVEEK